MPLDPTQRAPVMCLTLDGHALSHREQVRLLLEAGARLIQLRMKSAGPTEWTETAAACVALCRAAGATLIVNDSVDVALAAQADGVHLGKTDEAWQSARQRLGPEAILGGTVNNAHDARTAVASGVLDYVGVGPFRFTTTKAKLAPVLGRDGIVDLLEILSPLPAWAIGGITAADLPDLRETALAGVAVSSALFEGSRVADNLRSFNRAWPSSAPSSLFS